MKNPFSVLRHFARERAPRMPQAVGAAILGAIGISATATVAYIVGYIAITAVTSVVLRALAPKRPDVSGSAGLLTNVMDAVAPHEYVYGTVRKGGVRTYLEATGDQNKYLHMIIALAGHEVAGIDEVYINDEIVTLGGQSTYRILVSYEEQPGYVAPNPYVIEVTTGDDGYTEGQYLTSTQYNLLLAAASSSVITSGSIAEYQDGGPPIVVASRRITLKTDLGQGLVTDTKWNGKIRIKKHLGNQTAVDADLLAESNQITADFVGQGIAYLYVRLEYDQDTFATGIPLFTAVVRGRKVFDPRTSTTNFTANAALAVRDYLTSSFGLNDSLIDEASFAASANVSDETLSLAGGGVETRYEVNGVITADMSPRQVMERMMTTCNGTLFWGQGSWQLRVAYYSPPVKTFTLDDLRGPISLDTRASARDNFNRVTGTFIDAAAGYISSDYPAIKSVAFLAEDSGVENTLDLQLPMTTSAAAAQRLAKLIMFRAREQMTLTAEFGMEAFGVQVGDIVAFTNPRYGWTAKEFEVAGWRFETGQEGTPSIALTLRETSAAAFAWNAEELAIIRNNTTLPNFTSVAQLSNLTLTATALLNEDGAVVPALRADWDVSLNSFVEYYEIQYKRLGNGEDYGYVDVISDLQEDWGSITVSAIETEDYGLTNVATLPIDAAYTSVIGTSNSYTLAPVLNGYDYLVRVRAINSVGVRSPWISATVASAGDTTAPAEPTFVFATGAYKSVNISWINPRDLDLSHVEIYSSTTNNLATAILIGTSASTTFTHYGLSNNVTRYYWVRAVDYSTNQSPFSPSVSATTLLIAPNDFDDAVSALFTEAGKFGIKPVSTLPLAGEFDGQLVLLLPDIRIYRWDDATSAWSADIYAASSVEAGSVTYAAFASGIEPVGVVDVLPTVLGYTGPAVVVLTTDGKLYRLVDGVWTAAVPATDVTGQIVGTQISDDSITTAKITTDAITTGKIAAGAVNAAQIAAGAVVADKIFAGSVTTDKIATDAITANKIAASSIIASKIATGAVTADKISVSELSAISANIGTFQSAPTGQRIVISTDRIVVYDSSNNIRVKIGNLA